MVAIPYSHARMDCHTNRTEKIYLFHLHYRLSEMSLKLKLPPEVSFYQKTVHLQVSRMKNYSPF